MKIPFFKLQFIFVAFFLAIQSACFANPLNELELKKVSSEIFSEIYSPFCPGELLTDCPSSSANELKLSIIKDLQSGKSKEIIIEEVLNKYGKQYSALPAKSGFSALAWIIPIGFFLLGSLVILLILKRGSNENNLDSSSS